MNSQDIPTLSLSSQSGFALVAVMVILTVCTVLALSVSTTTNLNHLIATNDKTAKVDLYNQERCTSQAQVGYRTWLTNPFITGNETTTYFPQQGVDVDGNGTNDEDDATCVNFNNINVGKYKIRKIEDSGTPHDINGWEDIAEYDSDNDGNITSAEAENHPANSFPEKAHIDKPDPGTGYDPKNFEIRRFLVTSYSEEADKNVIIQKGVFKVFNNFN